MDPDKIDVLFELPLEEFTAARNALVKELRAQGAKDEAARVAKLKKPSAPVWAINQAARKNTDKIERLIEAGNKLRDAQKAVLKGADPAGLREATTEERKAVGELTTQAARALPDGATAAFKERITDTLSAIAVDPDLHDTLRVGTLDQEHQRVGFGDVPDLKLVPPLTTTTKKQDIEKEQRAQAEARRKEAEARAAELDDEADVLEREAKELQRRAEHATRKAKTLREQADAARRAHEQK